MLLALAHRHCAAARRQSEQGAALAELAFVGQCGVLVSVLWACCRRRCGLPVFLVLREKQMPCEAEAEVVVVLALVAAMGVAASSLTMTLTFAWQVVVVARLAAARSCPRLVPVALVLGLALALGLALVLALVLALGFGLVLVARGHLLLPLEGHLVVDPAFQKGMAPFFLVVVVHVPSWWC